MRRMRSGHRAGFTLIEVMAAFLVLSVVMTVIVRGLVIARQGADASTGVMEASNIARGLLEAPVPAGLDKPGRKTGKTGNYAWTIVTTPIQLPIKQAKKEESPAAFVPMRFTVTVVIDSRRQVRVETVRLAKVSS